ncbi:hypothetical protein D3C76_1190120 [compost metagenome]
MVFVFRGHHFRRLDDVAPLQLGQRARRDVQRVALLVDGFLLDRAERIDLGETFVDGVLEEAAAHGEHLGHRALGHLVRTFGNLAQSFRGDLAFALGDGTAERPPVLVDHVGIGFQLLAAADAGEPRFDHRTDPVGRWIQAELHEGLGVAAAEFQQRLAGDQQSPEQQALDVGPVRIERGFVASV